MVLYTDQLTEEELQRIAKDVRGSDGEALKVPGSDTPVQGDNFWRDEYNVAAEQAGWNTYDADIFENDNLKLKDLEKNASYIAAAKTVWEANNEGKSFDEFAKAEGLNAAEQNEFLGAYATEKSRWFHNNIAGAVIRLEDMVNDYDDEQKAAFLYMSQAYDHSDMTAEGFGIGLLQNLADPTMLVSLAAGVFSFGAGTAAGIGAREAGRRGGMMLLKKVMQEGLEKVVQGKVSKATVKAIGSNMIEGGIENTIQQNVKMTDIKTGDGVINYQKEFSYGEGATAAVMSGAGGFAINKVGKMASLYAKKINNPFSNMFNAKSGADAVTPSSSTTAKLADAEVARADAGDVVAKNADDVKVDGVKVDDVAVKPADTNTTAPAPKVETSAEASVKAFTGKVDATTEQPFVATAGFGSNFNFPRLNKAFRNFDRAAEKFAFGWWKGTNPFIKGKVSLKYDINFVERFTKIEQRTNGGILVKETDKIADASANVEKNILDLRDQSLDLRNSTEEFTRRLTKIRQLVKDGVDLKDERVEKLLTELEEDVSKKIDPLDETAGTLKDYLKHIDKSKNQYTEYLKFLSDPENDAVRRKYQKIVVDLAETHDDDMKPINELLKTSKKLNSIGVNNISKISNDGFREINTLRIKGDKEEFLDALTNLSNDLDVSSQFIDKEIKDVSSDMSAHALTIKENIKGEGGIDEKLMKPQLSSLSDVYLFRKLGVDKTRLNQLGSFKKTFTSGMQSAENTWAVSKASSGGAFHMPDQVAESMLDDLLKVVNHPSLKDDPYKQMLVEDLVIDHMRWIVSQADSDRSGGGIAKILAQRINGSQWKYTNGPEDGIRGGNQFKQMLLDCVDFQNSTMETYHLKATKKHYDRTLFMRYPGTGVNTWVHKRIGPWVNTRLGESWKYYGGANIDYKQTQAAKLGDKWKYKTAWEYNTTGKSTPIKERLANSGARLFKTSTLGGIGLGAAAFGVHLLEEGAEKLVSYTFLDDALLNEEGDFTVLGIHPDVGSKIWQAQIWTADATLGNLVQFTGNAMGMDMKDFHIFDSTIGKTVRTVTTWDDFHIDEKGIKSGWTGDRGDDPDNMSAEELKVYEEKKAAEAKEKEIAENGAKAENGTDLPDAGDAESETLKRGTAEEKVEKPASNNGGGGNGSGTDNDGENIVTQTVDGIKDFFNGSAAGDGQGILARDNDGLDLSQTFNNVLDGLFNFGTAGAFKDDPAMRAAGQTRSDIVNNLGDAFSGTFKHLTSSTMGKAGLALAATLLLKNPLMNMLGIKPGMGRSLLNVGLIVGIGAVMMRMFGVNKGKPEMGAQVASNDKTFAPRPSDGAYDKKPGEQKQAAPTNDHVDVPGFGDEPAEQDVNGVDTVETLEPLGLAKDAEEFVTKLEDGTIEGMAVEKQVHAGGTPEKAVSFYEGNEQQSVSVNVNTAQLAAQATATNNLNGGHVPHDLVKNISGSNKGIVLSVDEDAYMNGLIAEAAVVSVIAHNGENAPIYGARIEGGKGNKGHALRQQDTVYTPDLG